MASTYLTRAFSSNTSSTKCTWSFWVKFSAVNTGVSNTGSMLFQARNANNSNAYRSFIRYEENATLDFLNYNGSGSLVGEYYTKRKFRDCNSWYHICYSIDTTLSTASDRLKLYVNGVRETEFDTSNYTELPQNELVKTTSSVFTDISRNGGSAGYYFNGILSHYILTDGYVYQADTFGSTDTTTGEWKINPSPTISNWGSNGFWILKDGNSVTDSSPNSNTFTVGAGTLTKTEDCPSNVFCTWNPNYRSARKDMTLTNGNTFIFEQNSGDSGVSGTIAVSSGKWYWEQKIAQVNGTNAAITGGLHTVEDFSESPTDAMAANTVGMRSNGNVWKGTTDLGNFTAATYNNDIIGVGFDADNGSMYFWRNGTALNSGNAIITGMDMTKTWVPFGVQHGGARVTTSTNFGNGYFQTTAVSSAGTNASNNGIFEYDVPSGYTALSTKGLNL